MSKPVDLNNRHPHGNIPRDDGRCRFNCRTNEDAWHAALAWSETALWATPEDEKEAYRDWKRQQKKAG